jgi:hypothetical protein
VALDELDETTALSRGDLDVGDLAESLEERTELILGDIARQTADKHSGVVGVSELVHGLGSTVETHGGTVHRGVHASGAGHAAHVGSNTGTLVLGGGGGDTHGAVAAVDTLHLGQSTLLVGLIREANETVSTGHAADGIGHDLGRLARGEAALEKRNKNVFVNLRAEITNENRVLGTTVITAIEIKENRVSHNAINDERFVQDLRLPAISKATTGSPVQLEDTVGVGHGSAVQREGLGSGSRGGEVDKAVASIAPTTNIRTSGIIKKLDIEGKSWSYPENLSRIILTLTCSPIWNQRLRMKFSSIQGSSSPILFEYC